MREASEKIIFMPAAAAQLSSAVFGAISMGGRDVVALDERGAAATRWLAADAIILAIFSRAR